MKKQMKLFRESASPPLTRGQRVDNAKRLIEIHQLAYGANHQEDILPVILEEDREYLRKALR